ncbi:MAG: tRNA-modifying protein YgfZ [Acidimicrobiaceae bacterium]|nr:tRNA-modifying protein YgfZ [Acidimicrobiaceae bacterium]
MIERDVVRVEGPDALSFLQGQVSQDVAELAVGADALAFILQPQGKVDALVRVTRLAEDAFELDVDSGFGQAVADRLNRFKIRVKCEVTLAGSRPMPEPWGEGADRIDAAWPAMGKELDEKTIPAETGLVERAVSFTKGCFTGQELVARIDSRGGNVARHLRHVELDLPAGVDAPEGASVEVGGKERGRLTSVNGSTALAYVHRDVAPPADATVRWEGGQSPARILP